MQKTATGSGCRNDTKLNRTMFLQILLLTVLLMAPWPASTEPWSKTVTLDSGAIEGSVLGDILSFKGIPYAQPPLGSLRWQPPQVPVQSWAGVRNATNFGLDCLQAPTMTHAGSPPKGSD